MPSAKRSPTRWKWPGGSTRKGRRRSTARSIASLGAVPGGTHDLQIPPNTVAEHQGMTVLKAPAILHNFQPHMHYRGKAQTLEAIYPDGRREVINQVSHFTNNWHINYIYDPDYAPVFPKGTVLHRHVDSRQYGREQEQSRSAAVGEWGDRTVDEMAHLNEQVIYITEEDYRRIVEERKKRASTQN